MWWQRLERSLELNAEQPVSRFLQLATVRADGRPANRTVVYRGLLTPPQSTQRWVSFVSDARSDKHVDLARCAWAELCWYLPITREQYRLLGRAHSVSHDDPVAWLVEARRSAWERLSAASRAPFFGPPPGSILSEDAPGKTDISADAHGIPDTFCLLYLVPRRVDHVRLASAAVPVPTRDVYVADSDVDTASPLTWRVFHVQP